MVATGAAVELPSGTLSAGVGLTVGSSLPGGALAVAPVPVAVSPVGPVATVVTSETSPVSPVSPVTGDSVSPVLPMEVVTTGRGVVVAIDS